MKKLLAVLAMLILTSGCDNEPAATDATDSRAQVDMTASGANSGTSDAAAKADDKPAPVVATVMSSKPAAAVTMSGEDVYKKYCFVCHTSGAAGAPKLGDKVAWQPRIAKGVDSLTQSSITGIKGTAMPAKGNCRSCSDKDLGKAVAFILSKSQ